MTSSARASGAESVVANALPDVAVLGKWGGILTALFAGIGVIIGIGRQTQKWNQAAADLATHKAEVNQEIHALRHERRASDDERRAQYEDIRARLDHVIDGLAVLGKESARSEARLDALEREGHA